MASRVPDHSIDLLYVDGNHVADAVLDDLENYQRKISGSGVIMGNDFVKSRSPLLSHYGVIEGVMKFIQKNPAWHLLLINENRFADFLLSRDQEWEEKLIKQIRKSNARVRQLETENFLDYLQQESDIDFSNDMGLPYTDTSFFKKGQRFLNYLFLR